MSDAIEGIKVLIGISGVAIVIAASIRLGWDTMGIFTNKRANRIDIHIKEEDRG
jgi:hypothetical protein